jgi:hypothetical protein
VIQLLFLLGSLLLMELARFLISLRFRCGRLAELILRAPLVFLAALPSVKCPLLRRECLERLTRVASRHECVDSLLQWRVDLLIWPATLFSLQAAIWLPQGMKLRRARFGQRAMCSCLLLPYRSLYSRPLLSTRRSLS